MAFFAPLIPAAGWAATKLGALATAVKGLGAAKAATGVGSAMKAGATLPGVLGSAAGKAAPRMAGAAFEKGIGKALFGEMSRGQIASRLAPDAIFGGLAAVQTPGDIGDKLVAGGASLVGGGLGGLALSRGAAARGMGEGVQLAADFGGSILGDMGGMAVGDAVMRGKDKLMGGAGQTPYERMSAEQQAQFAEEIRRQTLAGAGIVPGLQDRYFDNTGMI
jgi:hypothetical protein